MPPAGWVQRTPINQRQPRHASLATASSAKQYQQAQDRVTKSKAARTRLPTTQANYHAQRLSQR